MGIIVNNKGTFDEQIEYVCKQTTKLTGMVLRSFQTRDKETMLTLLKTIILSKVDFGSIVWAPHKIKDLRKIEQIQSRFTKKISGMKDLDYLERLKSLRLYSIQRRFERYSIIYTWKILHGLAVNPGIEVKSTRISRQGLTLKIPKYTNPLREQSFLVKGPKLYNSLPKQIKEFPYLHEQNPKRSVDAFKREVDTYLNKIPDEPNLSAEYGKRMQGINIQGEKTNSIIRIN